MLGWEVLRVFRGLPRTFQPLEQMLGFFSSPSEEGPFAHASDDSSFRPASPVPPPAVFALVLTVAPSSRVLCSWLVGLDHVIRVTVDHCYPLPPVVMLR